MQRLSSTAVWSSSPLVRINVTFGVDWDVGAIAYESRYGEDALETRNAESVARIGVQGTQTSISSLAN